MLLLYADESNTDPATSEFLIYGGPVVRSEQAAALAKSIRTIRTRAGVADPFLLKFNPAPDGLTHDQFKQLKQAIIRTAVEHRATVIFVVTPHAIAGKDTDRALKFSINTACFHLNCMAHWLKQDSALVLLDRLKRDRFDALTREKISHGLTGMFNAKLDRVVGVHYSAIGQSDLCSLSDIVVGSFRFAVNEFCRGDRGNRASAEAVLGEVSPLFFRDGGEEVTEISLWFSPKEIRNLTLRGRCNQLIDWLTANGVRAHRRYPSPL